jgi:hypothetical protein
VNNFPIYKDNKKRYRKNVKDKERLMGRKKLYTVKYE